MTLGIMQPYFLPYIGYWQLVAAVDTFVVYDNIQYTKQGWINRNRLLRNGTDAWFTLPLKKASDFLDVADRELADDFEPARLLAPLAAAYRRAPFFAQTFPVIETAVAAGSRNLFDYLHHSIRVITAHLRIATPIVVSSTVPVDHSLKGEAKVLAMCQQLGATRYVNTIGGRHLYEAPAFSAQDVELRFLQPQPVHYRQYDNAFVPSLSIVDVMMFNSTDAVRAMLGAYDLI